MGNRVFKDSNESGQRRYIVDISGELPTILLELDPNMAIKKTYIYANGEILAQHDGNDSAPRYFYLHDRLGSVRQVINTNGNVVRHYTYEPFGQLIESGEADPNMKNPFMFTGQYFDSEIDEYYLRARMYDPLLGRFTSRDPVQGKFKEPLTLHRYLYCINDPINRVDPSGKLGETLVEPIMAGYSVHYGAIAIAAYGVAIGNYKFLTLGISMERMILPVMALAKARVSLGRYLDEWDDMAKANQMGNLKLPPGTPKWLAISIILAYLAGHLDGCQAMLDELPSAEDWEHLIDDTYRWEKAPDSPSGP